VIRAIGAAVAGWLTMVFAVMTLFAIGPLVLGLERILEPWLYRATALWIVCGMAIGLLAAGLGGWVAARLGRGCAPVFALAVLVVVGTLAGELTREPEAGPPAVRPSGQSVHEALQGSREHAVEPLVTRVANPIVALLGLWLGATLALRGARRRAGDGLRRDPPGAAGTAAA
jgi:hypothetical protein